MNLIEFTLLINSIAIACIGIALLIHMYNCC
jgi:hypothetical protein